MDRAELAGWLRLALTPRVGRETARKLLAAFGLPEQVFSQTAAALQQVVSATAADLILREPDGLEAQVALTLDWLQSGEHRTLVTLGDPRYPASLLQIEDPPLMLFAMGRGLETLGRAVAIVGSRNPTPQGCENARRFATALAQAEVTVISGLALGIDAAAHEGALEGARADQLATVAVVGTGLDRVYPRQHLPLARRIAQQGLLVSEYLLGTPPLAPNFPMRNRIISGLSQGTLVIEAAVKSGSLITARCAAEQGREVFAVPGSIHSPQSRGCHALIRQGAKLVESAQDVLEDLRWQPALPRVDATPTDQIVPQEEDDLLQAMGFDAVGLDALVARTGIPASQLQARLLEHELDGHVARIPGGLFQRIVSA